MFMEERYRLKATILTTSLAWGQHIPDPGKLKLVT